MQGLIIAGTNSGCGKTTITIGLMNLLKLAGYSVAPFKAGPDYIDPLFHKYVLNKNSYNLDSFLMSGNTINYLYNKQVHNNDLAIIEGVMGYYDGLGTEMKGSTYELASLLNIPVILTINCKGLYQSVSAIVKGYCELMPHADIKGVILNNVSNYDQFSFLKSEIEKRCNVVCIGYLPNNSNYALESRHLGLVQAEEDTNLKLKIELLTNTLKQTIDIDSLMNVAGGSVLPEHNFTMPAIDLSNLRIGVAYDKAFRFYYHHNIELLTELGAKLHYFSPLRDSKIPAECNCLYIGGGYPEVFAQELSDNKPMLMSINNAAQNNMPIYAECGGLMYLTESIIDIEGNENNMCGVFNSKTQMTNSLQHFGYCNIEYNGESTFAHEFHKSKIDNRSQANYTLEYTLSKQNKNRNWQCGLKHKNTLGAYAHIHFYSNFKFFEQITKLWKQAII